MHYHMGSKTGKAPKKMDDLDELGRARYKLLMKNPFHTADILGWLQVVYSSAVKDEKTNEPPRGT